VRGYDPGVVHPDPEHSGSRDRIRVPLALVPPQLPGGVVLPNGVLVGPWGGGGFPTGTGPLGSIKDLFGGADPRDLPDPWDPKSGRERGRPTVKPGSSRGRDATHGIGMFGKEKNPVVDAMLDWIAHSHDLPGFDPTGGYGRKRGPLRPDFGVREIGKKEVIQRIVDSGHQNDPRRRDPRVGGPHVDWWGEEPSRDLRRMGMGGPSAEEVAAAEAKQAAADKEKKMVAGGLVAATGTAAILLLSGVGEAFPVTSFAIVVTAGFLGAAAVHHFWRPSDDDPTGGGGVGGPRGSYYLPDPESSGGGIGGPRGNVTRPGTAWLPDPETGTGGGPRSLAILPNPEDPSAGTGPRS